MQVAPRLPLHRRPIATHFPDDERLWYRGLRFGEASELNPSWYALHASHALLRARGCMPRLPPHAIERMRKTLHL